jgi:hypothetical protein
MAGQINLTLILFMELKYLQQKNKQTNKQLLHQHMIHPSTISCKIWKSAHFNKDFELWNNKQTNL